MSDKERVMQLIEQIPEYKLGYVIAYLQGLTADESIDDLYCEELLSAYQNSTDKGDFVTFDEAVAMCGVDINAIQN